MFTYTIKFALKVFRREKFFTAINIGGLALGFATCILLVGYVAFEFSYEEHIENSDEIYRVITKRSKDGITTREGVRGPSKLAKVAPSTIPNINAMTRAFYENCLIRTENKKFADQKIFWVDKDFFKVFKGILLSGNPETVLDAPLKMVLTESKAFTLFGDEDPIGKTIRVNEGMPFKVTGVVKDPPANTHFKYDYLNTLSTFVYYEWNNGEGRWDNSAHYNYLSIDKDASKETVEQALNKLALLHVNPKDNNGSLLEFHLQEIKDIHLTSQFADEIEINGDLRQVYIVIGIGLAILCIVFINFVNLSTTISLKRTKDTGIKKTFGATAYQLKIQYFVEAFLLNLSALVIAATLVIGSYPFLENIFNITFKFSVLLDPVFCLAAILVFSTCVFAVSSYPAFVGTSIEIDTAIKGKIVSGKSNNTLVKQILLIGQFAASIFLTVGALVVYQQVDFMRNYDLGITTDQVLVLRGPTTLNAAWNDTEKVETKKRKYKLFKEELLKNVSIKEVASSYNIPGEESRIVLNGIKLKRTGEEIQTKIELRTIDENFLSIYQAKFLSGKNFSSDFLNQRKEVIINDKTRKLLGFKTVEEAIGEFVALRGSEKKIIGVTANFHMKSLSENISPSVFINLHPLEFGYYLAKLDQKNIKAQLAYIETKWREIYPEDPFVTQFSDNYFNQQYAKQEQFGSIFNALTLLAILIANLGLLAMISLTTTEKLKEISIRRVLGANTKHVFVLISKGFIKLIGIGACIAIPASWYFLSNWLEGFAYRINMESTVFIGAAIFIILIALLNITYFVIKVLRYNPIAIIREE